MALDSEDEIAKSLLATELLVELQDVPVEVAAATLADLLGVTMVINGSEAEAEAFAAALPGRLMQFYRNANTLADADRDFLPIGELH